ncbi:MAG: hypothetical protein NZ561_07785 [Phycisphaerae bacterium]|nr:hypothetical protein [Phycisphaerae bacterium]MDW8262803.1 hypothetical protein [Phycisphaerales bacterium]
MRLLTHWAVVVVLCGWFTSPVEAKCPKCRVATGDLEIPRQLDPEVTTSSGTQPAADDRTFRGFSIAFGIDVPTAYYYRGYLQQDRGVILQPFLTLSANFQPAADCSIQPYIGWTNTIFSRDNGDLPVAHSGGVPRIFRSRVIEIPGDPPSFELQLVPLHDGRGWYESDIMVGVTVYWKDVFFDLNYHVHIFPSDVHDAMHEIGGKISYDLAGLWDATPASQRSFSLRPGLTIYHETSDQNGDQETFIEVSLEPTWRFKLFGRRAAVSVPVALAGSDDGYYVDANDFDTQTLGYFSAAVKGSISLPIDRKFGDWYLNASIQYLHLISDGLVRFNRDDADAVIGSIGVGVSF